MSEDNEDIPLPVMRENADDEELVDLTPEQAERVRKEKEERLARRKAAYKSACEEGERLMQTGSYRAAELAFERALDYDELATEASVGYWRAKTADFTQPDVLVEEYLEEGYEQMESDLGVIATEIIKRDYRAVFENRLRELNEQEAPYLKEVEEKQALRRPTLRKRRAITFWVFLASIVPFVGALIATMVVGLKNFSTPDNTFVVPTIVCGVVALAAFLFFLAVLNKFFNACRMYRMNENLASTEAGKAVLDIREYKEVYEALLVAPTAVEEKQEEDGE